MEGQVFIDNLETGTLDLKIIDQSTGVIGGDFVAAEYYWKYKNEIQKLTEGNGNASSHSFDFKTVLENIEMNPIGEICLIDSEELGEMYLDAGISD